MADKIRIAPEPCETACRQLTFHRDSPARYRKPLELIEDGQLRIEKIKRDARQSLSQLANDQIAILPNEWVFFTILNKLFDALVNAVGKLNCSLEISHRLVGLKSRTFCDPHCFLRQDCNHQRHFGRILSATIEDAFHGSSALLQRYTEKTPAICVGLRAFSTREGEDREEDVFPSRFRCHSRSGVRFQG